MKNKLLHFVLDLFSASDDEEQDSIFAQVKIYRTASVRIFEYIIGILLLAIWLLISSETSSMPQLRNGTLI